MQKRKIGVLTFSDGRKFAHDLQYKMNKGFQDKLVKVLEKTGEIECVPCEIIWTPALARTEAKKLAAAGVEATILNFAIWAFPHLPAIATEFAPGPFLCLSNVNPQAPGLVAMLAAAGSLSQIGVFHGRVSGDVGDPKVLKQVMAFLRAASAVNRLRGKTYGLFGGRSMGMYTAVPALDQWRREFGVDIEHIDQWEIVRRSETIDQKRVTAARKWLEKHCAQVAYDGKALIINGPTDHVHILASLAAKHSLSDLMRELKADSSGWVHKNVPEQKKFAWQIGYGAFSVSHSNLAEVENYIATQEEHHKRMSFKEEFVAFLKKHGIQYDEKYLWE